jgi:putative IMPACT (imprinted ancient) family translation regulator
LGFSLLQKKYFFNYLVVVISYGKGIKLGRGGLRIAYTKAAQEVIK